jgi:hypothetical protein
VDVEPIDPERGCRSESPGQQPADEAAFFIHVQVRERPTRQSQFWNRKRAAVVHTNGICASIEATDMLFGFDIDESEQSLKVLVIESKRQSKKGGGTSISPCLL